MSPGKTMEPFWWSLFSAGGVVAAFLVPVHLFLHGLAIPLGWVSVSHARLLALVGQPLVKMYLFVLISYAVFCLTKKGRARCCAYTFPARRIRIAPSTAQGTVSQTVQRNEL